MSLRSLAGTFGVRTQGLCVLSGVPQKGPSVLRDSIIRFEFVLP